MPVIFGCTIILIFLLQYEIKKNAKNKTQTVQEFLQRELEANTTRKQDISGLAYQTADLSWLPDLSGIPDADGEIAAVLAALKRLQGKQYLNLSGISNTDLKLTYGAANFPFLSECDANFTAFMRRLYDLGLRLNEAGAPELAVPVLEYAVRAGTDVGSTYRLLGSIYALQGNNDALLTLCRRAEELPETIRSSVCDYLSGLCR
ncbi:MAG: hypothetical protein K2P87_13255 [Lachnospiraceae bacterium]|nr:hypothetical protein [Lachnospiraceae bacterium]